MTQIVCKDLAVGYDGRTVASGLNFTVSEGDYLCILGENGSGKTTLMKTLLGLIPAVSGEIIFGEGFRKNGIGYLPQQTPVQRDFPASVEEIVLSGYQNRMGLRPFYTKEMKAGAVKNMERLDILKLRRSCYRELSGGQQQRVLLARALCAAERILLLDEPVTGLDQKAAGEMYGLTEKLHKEGCTIMMISHDVEAALHYADHILHIGADIFFGSPEEYLKHVENAGKKDREEKKA